MRPPLLRLRGLGRRFGRCPVLQDLELDLEPGARLTVAGRSGTGKTTLLRLIAGLEAPDAGEILLGGRLASRPGHVLLPPWRRDLQMVFQNLGLWPLRSARDHVADALRAGGLDRRRAREKAQAYLARLGLAAAVRRRPGSLSGGEARRLAFARALAPGPGLLLLDEPFTSLDPVARDAGLGFLEEILAATSAAVILVTHEPAEALALGGHVTVLADGRLGAARPAEELCADPAVFRAALEA